MDLKKYGITGVTEIVYNPSYDELFREETKKGLRGFEKGQLTETGAVNVMTGVYTGRSPKDKFFVLDDTTKDTIWWTSDEYKNDNKPISEKSWKALKELADKPEEKAKFIAEKEKEYNDKFSNPYNAAKYGYIDDVIEPRNTRFRIIRALQSLATKRLTNPAKKHSNIPL